MDKRKEEKYCNFFEEEYRLRLFIILQFWHKTLVYLYVNRVTHAWVSKYLNGNKDKWVNLRKTDLRSP